MQDRLAVDIILQVGAINETMTVSTTTPQLETETSELGQVVSGKQATTLPLNGRNFAQLAQLAAGVAPAEPGSRTETSFGFSSNGARALQNNYLLDGIDNNANLGDVLNGSAYVIQPSVDAIGEFKVQTNSYSSEFGRGNGAIMNAVIKSGTNAFHGNAYEFFRNDKLDGRNAFDFLGRQPYQQNQFGATFGGPIIKDRTFFFVDYEGLRIRQALPQLLLIPTPEQLAGDFSSFLDLSTPILDPQRVELDCSGNQTYQGEIFDPHLTQTVSASGNYPSGMCGFPIGSHAQPVPTNIFPAGSIDPVAAGIAALFPAPLPGSTSVATTIWLIPRRSQSEQLRCARRSQIYGPATIFSLASAMRTSRSSHLGRSPTSLMAAASRPGTRTTRIAAPRSAKLHTFSSTLLNEFRLGYNRINSHRSQPFSNAPTSPGSSDCWACPFTPGIGGLPSDLLCELCVHRRVGLPALDRKAEQLCHEREPDLDAMAAIR